jgi:hypothetical protein
MTDTELLDCLCCGEPVVNPEHPNVCADCLRRLRHAQKVLRAALARLEADQ